MQYNNAPSTYVWQVTTGTTPPTGSTGGRGDAAVRPNSLGRQRGLDQDGWSNDSALQFNYQRPFKNGFAYQVFYVFSRAFRVGGNTFRDNTLYPAATYAPGVLPSRHGHGDLISTEPGI